MRPVVAHTSLEGHSTRRRTRRRLPAFIPLPSRERRPAPRRARAFLWSAGVPPARATVFRRPFGDPRTAPERIRLAGGTPALHRENSPGRWPLWSHVTIANA